MSSIFSGKAGRQAAMFQAGQLQKGQDEGNAALDTGYDRASAAYGQAGTTLGNLADSYSAGSTLYQDALGVNGADGSAAAKAAYTTAPGYTFNMDQGLQALDRTRAVNGTLASGNADTDAMKFASGLASQDYNNWLTNLSGLDTKRFTATTGQAGTFGALGQAALGVGQAKAGLAQQTAAGIGQAGANGLMAGQQASANTFGALIGGLSGLGSLAGGIGKAYTAFA
ncbi:hypothetical protein MKK70_21205 [Methylobacterium sp. E-041]|uniref:hypothetical protein n=1 Tax=Methylobacterium sp. E-041 TaxID=2836573 RepID=UPI001FBA18D7|nr:hypothetical protein [Methylobacterium sp. E-041]MCJ2107848.1 hypothetical protein [Methylobacterium sp. E-041]